MKAIDAETIESYGIPAVVLMENAGANVVSAMGREIGGAVFKTVNIFCGQGNNGGDGFVVARHLKSEGAYPRIFFAGVPEKLSPEAKINHDAAEKYGIEIIKLAELADVEKNAHLISSCDAVVDALFGTGLDRDVDGLMAGLIVLINSIGRYTVAVDIPSGVDADTGDIRGVAVYASLTVTFGLPKAGITIFPGLEYVGKLIVADINFPVELLSRPRQQVLITKEIAAPMLPYRHPNANKGHFGPVLIIGGSKGMGGAVSLAAKAALKAGAGIVTACVPESLHDSVKCGNDEVIVAAVKETDDGFISAQSYERIIELANKAKIVVIGPGMGRKPETAELARRLIREIDKPLVIDADGINAVSEDKNCLKNIKKDVIITPHIGEMSGLCGVSIEMLIRDKIGALKEFVDSFKVNVVLKDGRSITIDTEKNIYVNTTGNSGMATPGSGDVLAGVIAAFMAHGLISVRAAISANYAHGLAGDLLLNEISGEGITAGDIVKYIPVAIKNMKQ